MHRSCFLGGRHITRVMKDDHLWWLWHFPQEVAVYSHKLMVVSNRYIGSTSSFPRVSSGQKQTDDQWRRKAIQLNNNLRSIPYRWWIYYSDKVASKKLGTTGFSLERGRTNLR